MSNFGSAPTNQPFGSTNTGGNNIFGNTAQASATGFGQSTNTGAFGSKPNTLTTGFGAQPTSGFGTSTTMGFGSAAPAATPGFGSAAPTTASAFGSAAPTTTSGFGSGAPATGFGSAAPAASGFGSSIFGGGAKPAAFGASAAPATTSLFGAQPAATNTSGFQSSLFGQNTAQQQQPMGQSQFPQAQNQLPIEPHLAEYIQYLGGCWDANHPQCQFKHYFYNLVHPSEVSLYGPQQGEDQVLYEQACQDNPDPTCLVPVLGTGFSGLKTRLTTQEEQLKTHKEKLQEFQERVENLQKKHSVETSVKIEAYKRKQRRIVHQVFSLMKTVQILRNRGFSLRAEEEALFTRLLAMDRDLAKPSVFRGRLNEIWAYVQQLKDADRLNGGRQALSVLNSDESELQPLVKSLSEIGKGLGQLTKVIQEDTTALDNIIRSYEEHSINK